MKRFKKIYIEITNICNLSCNFCLISKRDKQSMSYSQLIHIINEIKPYTDYIYIHVKGEPLLHQELDKILLLCENNNIKVNIVTNGTLLNNKKEILLNSKAVRQISISMHSLTNKEGIENDMKDILEFTKEALKNNIIISYRFWNINNENNINAKIFNIIGNYFCLDDSISKKLTDEKSIKICSNLYINKDMQFSWPTLSSEFISDKGFCYGLKDQIAILVDGTVVPCCLDGEGIIKLGNIFEDSFESILAKEKTKRIIKAFLNNKVVEELCQKCSYKNRFNKG